MPALKFFIGLIALLVVIVSTTAGAVAAGIGGISGRGGGGRLSDAGAAIGQDWATGKKSLTEVKVAAEKSGYTVELLSVG